jgi:hypothetical protein
MLKQRSSFMPKPLVAGMALALIFQASEAAWLRTYGTADDESGFGLIQALDGGGFLVDGASVTNGKTVHWYGRLNDQGKALWVKSSGDVAVTPNADGTAHLAQAQLAGAAPRIVTGEGKLDLATGAIGSIQVDENKTVKSDNGILVLSDATGLVVGTYRTSPANADAALAKLGADDRIEWSHRYDFSGNDITVLPQKLKSGYLLSMNQYDFDPATFELKSVTVLAKIDETGNLVPGKAKTVGMGGESGAAPAFAIPWPLADDSVIVLLGSAESLREFRLVKLDRDLNFVWGKRYYSQSPLDALIGAGVHELSDGALQILGASLLRYDSQNSVVEKHPLYLTLDPASGAIKTRTEIKIRNFDPEAFAVKQADKAFLLNGAVSDTGETQNQDGLFASFDANLQPKWARIVAGAQRDQVDTLQALKTSGYIMGGSTESFGAGQGDYFFGRLDANGAVSGCPAIQDIAVAPAPASIAQEDIDIALAPATLVDNGSFSFSIDAQRYALTVNPADFPLVVGDLCEAADPAAAGSIGVSPERLAFGAVAPGKSATLQATITNGGAGPLHIGTVSAPAAPFEKTADNCSNKTLAAGAGCALGFRFAPTAEGPASATVEIESNDPNHAVVALELSGVGTSQTLPPQFQSLSSADVGFGAQIALTGQGFANAKGKVLIGGKSAGIVAWTDSSIAVTLPSLKAGVYPIRIVTKSGVSLDASQIELHLPQLDGLSETSGAPGATLTLQGQYFGAGPKVFLVSGKKSKAAKVLPQNTDERIDIKVPALKPGVYQVVVSNGAGKSAERIDFEAKAKAK